MNFDVPGFGIVEIRKSTKAKRVILKIKHDGSASLTLPKFVPYALGKQYAQKHRQWLIEHARPNKVKYLTDFQQIGRNHKLEFKVGEKISSRVSFSSISITHPVDMEITHPDVQSEAKKAATRAIRRQAEQYLPSRLYEIAQAHSYSYKDVRCKALKTRWGSCSSNRVINLNIWLMQLPDELIDYVLVHELAHLNNPHHQPQFWQEVSKLIPDYKLRRKALKQYNPSLIY